MSIRFKTSDPKKLLSTFKKAIDDGDVQTWSYDQDGDFTHSTSTEQWKNQAWLRPKIGVGEIIFIILSPKNTKLTSVVYAVYHGRFLESMLTHCDSLFTSAESSALPQDGDITSS